MKVSVARARLRELHPADIAEILEDMSPREVGQLIHDMPDEKAADVMEELEPEFQAEVLETLPDEKAADIVEEMEPDEAADALQEMEEDKRAQVFNLMEPDESATVSALLEHPEDTAGGLMTTKYVTVPPDLLIADAFQRVRQEAAAKEAETNLLGVRRGHGRTPRRRDFAQRSRPGAARNRASVRSCTRNRNACS